MGIGARIKAARKGKYNQAELAELVGVHETTIRRWELERDDGPQGKNLSKLAEVLNTTVAYLSGETDNPARGEGAMPQPKKESIANARPVETIAIPLISGVVRACCGVGNTYAEEVEWEIEDEIRLPLTDLLGYMWGVGREALGAIRVEGDSMEPRIHDGDIVVFVRDKAMLTNGCFAFVKYNGRLMVRAFYDDGRGNIRLRPLNPHYEEVSVNLDEGDELITFGKVIRRVNTDNLADGV